MSPDTRDAANRPALSRDTIVTAAILQVQEVGLSRLTMRSLGQRLGVEAMSLYYHVNGREDLLEAIVDRLVEEGRVHSDQSDPMEGWQGYLQLLAQSFRTMAITYPQVFPLIATRHPAAPWLRPPLRSLAVVEDFLTAMSDKGLRPHQTVMIYKAFSSFLLGHLLLEVAVIGAPTSPPDEPLDEGEAPNPNRDQDLALDDFPTVHAYRELLSHHEADAEFERALEALLDRLDLDLSQ